MITNRDISATLQEYLQRHPKEARALAEPERLLSQGPDCASRQTFPAHTTVGALLVRDGKILLVEHRAYGILLQPGGHLEPGDSTLPGAALRELAEETGIDPGSVSCVSELPVCAEYGQVPARPEKGEPSHWHLDFGYVFTTDGDIGRIQESEVTNAGWYPLAEAEHLVGWRIGRAASVHADRGFC